MVLNLHIIPSYYPFQMRQNLRDKYGIQKKESGPSKSAIESVKEQYKLGEEEAKKFDQAIAQVCSRGLILILLTMPVKIALLLYLLY